MIGAWLNATAKVQRRSGTSRNVLGEPDWGDESSYGVTYAAMPCRVEVVEHVLEFKETGERVKETSTWLFFEPPYLLLPMDRVTLTVTDDPQMLNHLYLVMDAHPRWDSVGNVHHYVATLQVH
jgi:hypothetical protein